MSPCPHIPTPMSQQWVWHFCVPISPCHVPGYGTSSCPHVPALRMACPRVPVSPCPCVPMSLCPHVPTSPHPHVPTSPYTTQCHWRNPISLLVLSALSDHLQKLMQCIYILDTPYLFEVTYVIYLDTIVCHLCTAFFLSLFFFF